MSDYALSGYQTNLFVDDARRDRDRANTALALHAENRKLAYENGAFREFIKERYLKTMFDEWQTEAGAFGYDRIEFDDD